MAVWRLRLYLVDMIEELLLLSDDVGTSFPPIRASLPGVVLPRQNVKVPRCLIGQLSSINHQNCKRL